MRRSTLIYVLLFIAVLGAGYYFNNRAKNPDNEAALETEAPTEYLYTAADGLPSGIRIESKEGQIVEVARNTENAWSLIQPAEAMADQGAVEAAASQVSTLRIMDRLSDLSPAVVGLDRPEYTITLKFPSDMERKLEIGVITPTQSGYYARGEDGGIMIISKSGVDSLLEMLTNPPYAPTATPPPTATP